MFTEKEGITSKNHLIKTIAEYSSLKPTIQYAQELVDNFFEHGVEIYQGSTLAGYLLVFNVFGTRSFHGYKFIEGHGVHALSVSKQIIEKFQIKFITTTIDQLKTIRLARLLGFCKEQRMDNFLILERG
jgi:hypothetical protein